MDKNIRHLGKIQMLFCCDGCVANIGYQSIDIAGRTYKRNSMDITFFFQQSNKKCKKVNSFASCLAHQNMICFQYVKYKYRFGGNGQ